MKVSCIVAIDENRVIGYEGKMPWHLPADLAYFKAVTLGKPIIMGRTTYEHLPKKPLPGRINVVLSRTAGYEAPGCLVFSSLPEALAALQEHPEVMIIGGAQVYAAALPLSNYLYITHIRHAFKGDTLFPIWDTKLWREISIETHPADERNPYAYSFQVLEKI
ncbi:MAG: dihydrofolate reductase [Pseudomonadota bacterium]